VILTRNALRESNSVLTIVDNRIAERNVTRMAERAGSTVEVEARDDGTYLRISRIDGVELQQVPQAAGSAADGPTVVVVPSEFMGRGEHAELGQVLIRGFFHALGEVDPLPDTIIFFNSGVKLVVEGSQVLEDLDALCAQGVEILACGTCLQYYGLTGQLAAGEVSNMYTIVETILGASRSISL
jgi:selenium metabolism protein YedF